MAKATMATRTEIIKRYEKAYRKANKKEKGEILDNICLSTGLSRSRVKHIFSQKISKTAKISKRGRKKKYDAQVAKALEEIWIYMDYACGRRLVAGMEDMILALEDCGEINFSKEVLTKLKEISASTADRLLAKVRKSLTLKGKSTTKPGTLLKSNIPIRLGTEWDENIPGYVEIDLVAHCGDTTAGDYVNTLDVTDIFSGWTETQAVLNKAQIHVITALENIQTHQPFDFLGIDSDNGSEFINAHLYRWCNKNNIHFTRTRPGRKNDNCHVEQKNWHIVRRNIGYGRYEGQEAVDIMNEYYSLLRLYSNFFSPQTKLIEKIRNGARIKKIYDKPKTPYRRLIDSNQVEDNIKTILTETFASLNPAALKRDMANILSRLEALVVQR